LRQARQKGALHSGRKGPCPRSQAAGAVWHHGVGTLRPWASAGRCCRPAFDHDCLQVFQPQGWLTLTTPSASGMPPPPSTCAWPVFACAITSCCSARKPSARAPNSKPSPAAPAPSAYPAAAHLARGGQRGTGLNLRHPPETLGQGVEAPAAGIAGIFG
jgi:hypothetical protein